MVTAWSESGLFSSVAAAPSHVPTATGVFISTVCKTDVEQVSPLMTLTLWLMTVGIVPAAQFDYETHCDTNFYQNGHLLQNSNTTFYNQDLGNGFAVIPLLMKQSETSETNSNDIAVLVVANAINNLGALSR